MIFWNLPQSLTDIWLKSIVSAQCLQTVSISTCPATTSPSLTPTCPRWRTWRAAGTSATTRTTTTAGPSTTIQQDESASYHQVRSVRMFSMRLSVFVDVNLSVEVLKVSSVWQIFSMSALFRVTGHGTDKIWCSVWRLMIIRVSNHISLCLDDSISLPTQLQQDSGFIFSEKSGCNNGKILSFYFTQDLHFKTIVSHIF